MGTFVGKIVLFGYFSALIAFAQTVTTRGNAAFAIVAGGSVELQVEVRAANGGLAVNSEVLFVAPGGAASGFFPESTESDKTWVRVHSAADGIARTRYQTPPATASYALVSAQLPMNRQAGAYATFAISALASITSSSSTAQSMRADLLRQYLPGGETELVRLHGPFVLGPGTTVSSALPEDVPFPGYPHSAQEAEWFFWIDDKAPAQFAHPVRYGRAPINNPNARQISNLSWYPVVRIEGRNFKLLPAIALNDTAVAATSLSISVEALALGGTTAPPAAPSDACAILIRGPDLDGTQEGLTGARNFLLNNDLVNPANILTREIVDGEKRIIRPMTRQLLDETFAELKRRNCKKLFLFYDGHGSPAEWGPGLCLQTPDDDGTSSGYPLDFYSYETLANRIASLGPGIRVCFAVSACFSGQLLDWLQGLGIQGEGLTTASRSQIGYSLTLWKHIAPSLEASKGNFQQAHRDLVNNPSMFVSGPNPQYGQIMPTGTRRMAVPYVYFKSPAEAGVVFSRPAAALTNSAFNLTLIPTNPTIGRLSPNQIVLPPTPAVGLLASGLREGLTSVAGTASENDAGGNAQAYRGEGAIQVGSFRVHPNPCYTEPGGSCAMTIERIIPIPDVDKETTFDLFLYDKTIASVEPATLKASETQTTLRFTIRGLKKGSTKLWVWDNRARTSMEVPVIVEDPPRRTSVVPESCIGQWNYFVSTERTNEQHICCTQTTSNWPMRVDIAADGRVTVSSSGGGFPNTMTGTTGPDCTLLVTGGLTIAGIATQARLEGTIGPNSTIGNQLRWFDESPGLQGADRAVAFDAIRFNYAVGTDGRLPGGQAATFRGTGRTNATTTCTYTIANPSIAIPSTGGAFTAELQTGDGCAWTAAASSDFVELSALQGTGAIQFGFRVSPNFNAAGRSATFTLGGRAVTVNQAGVPARRPQISGVFNGASFDRLLGGGSWVTITGVNLAGTTRVWSESDFSGGRLPEQLDGTSATIGGKAAFVYFISPTQINVLMPDDPNPVLPGAPFTTVQVRREGNLSEPFEAPLQERSPALFQLDPEQRRYVAAVHADGVLAARPGLYPGLTTRAAKPGDIVLLYLTGLGATLPDTPAGSLVRAPARISGNLSVDIGGQPAEVLFAGKVANGLYQVNLRVPMVAAGDQSIRVWMEGERTQAPVYLTIGP
ncbi:MAG: hypothetical protein NW208_09415 [Bryobacter sp.]|nr:hypothetical protein [Bryobacter sp.]